MSADPVVRTDEPATKQSPSLRVIEAYAAAEGVDPLKVDSRLYDSIDPEALDALFGPTGSGPTAGRVAFPVGGREVIVEGDGEGSVIVSVYGDPLAGMADQTSSDGAASASASD